MSRKKKNVLPADTGGLDLTAGTTKNEPVLGLDLADKSDWSASTPLEVGQQVILNDKVATVEAVAPTGLKLFAALSLSDFLRMAAHKHDQFPDVVVVSNGHRYWTARLADFEPVLVDTNLVGDLELERSDWRPVVGSERGLTLG